MKNKNLLQVVILFSACTYVLRASEPVPLGLVREPRIRVTPIYYELLLGVKEFEPIWKKALKAVADNEDFKNLGQRIKQFDKDISGYEDDLKQFDSDIARLDALKKERKIIIDPGSERGLKLQRDIFELEERLKKDPEFRRVKKAVQQEIRNYTASRDQALQRQQDVKVEAIRGVLQRDIPSNIIKTACEKKRTELIENRTRLTRELEMERLSFEEKIKKRQKLSDIKYELEQTAHACPILLDDTKRAAYDRGLASAKEAPTGIFDALRRGIERAQQDPPDQFIIVNDMVGKFLAEDFKEKLKDLFGDIPPAVAKIFNQNIALRSIDFLPKPSGEDVRYWVGFSGLMELNKFDVRVSVYMVQDIYGMMRMSFAVELPDHYKLSDLIPGFTLLDTFSLPKAKLIFSNFAYFDRVFIRKGLTFVAEVDFSGPLKLLSDMKEKSKHFKSLVFENEPILLSGYLPSNIIQNYLDARFELRVPLHFGFDLRKIAFIPQSISKVVQQITSDDFRLIITPREQKEEGARREEAAREKERKETFKALPFAEAATLAETKLAEKIAEKIKPSHPLMPEAAQRVAETVPGVVSPVPAIVWGRFNIEGEAGARVVLGTQPDPLLLTLLINLRPSWNLLQLVSTTLAASVNLKTMLQLKWLAIGDAAIQVEWDTALMAAMVEWGVPFTGFGIRGRIDLGKPGESRAQFEAAGGFRVSTTEVPGLLINLKGKNIRFADIISYASYLAAKAQILKGPIAAKNIPTITFHAVEGYAALADMKIGHKYYPAGLGLHVETELFKKKIGLRLDMSNEFRVSGFAYIPRFDVRVRGYDIFKLYDSFKPDRGPQVRFAFDPQKPLEGYFNLSGAFEIPSIRLKQDVQFAWSGWNLDADFESSIAGITVMFGARINTRPWMAKAIEEVMAYPEVPKKVTVKTVKEERGLKTVPERFAEIKEAEPQWRHMDIKFGFKQDFAEFMTKISKSFLQKMKTAASNKLKEAAASMRALKARGAKGFDAEIERTRRSIARTEQRLQQAKEICAQARWYKKFTCAKVAAQQITLTTKKSYLNALLKPTKVVVTGAAQLSAAAAQKMAAIQEFALENAITGLELIQAGFSVFKIKEVLGELRDFKAPILRRFVAEVHLMGAPRVISLYDVPFDFLHIGSTIAEITRQVMRSFMGKSMEYVEMYERPA